MTKTCFIISTIGKEGEEPFKVSKLKLNFLYEPVLKKLGYEVIRADGEDAPGSISRKIVERIINSELAIADISDLNANVFYELAIRNAVNKPVILVRNPGQSLPFDIKDIRAISVDMREPEIWQEAKTQLEKYVKEAEENPTKASESIVSDFVKSFQITKDAKSDPLSEISRELKDLASEVRRSSAQKESSTDIGFRTHTIPTHTHSVFDDIRGVTTGRISNTYADVGSTITTNIPTANVKCKKCNKVFSADVPTSEIQIIAPRTITLFCPYCNTANVIFL